MVGFLAVVHAMLAGKSKGENAMTSPNVKTLLDVSTAHLRPSDMEALDAIAAIEGDQPRPLRVYGDEYGWYVSVGALRGGDDGEAAVQRSRAAGLSTTFLNLMFHARSLGVEVVRFDAEADLEPGFPVFDHVIGAAVDPSDYEPAVQAP